MVWSYNRLAGAGAFTVNPQETMPAAGQAWPKRGARIVALLADAAVIGLELCPHGRGTDNVLPGGPAIGSTGGQIPLSTPGAGLPPYLAGNAGAACTISLVLELQDTQ